jgi:hypothetical protein
MNWLLNLRWDLRERVAHIKAMCLIFQQNLLATTHFHGSSYGNNYDSDDNDDRWWMKQY